MIKGNAIQYECYSAPDNRFASVRLVGTIRPNLYRIRVQIRLLVNVPFFCVRGCNINRLLDKNLDVCVILSNLISIMIPKIKIKLNTFVKRHRYI